MAKNKYRVKPNLRVFGSRTFKDTTELIAMDYHGMYRTYCLGSFKIVSMANNVKILKKCFEMCLRFSMAVKGQVTERSEMRKLTDAEVIKLTKASRKLLTHTSFTLQNRLLKYLAALPSSGHSGHNSSCDSAEYTN
ncbi:hypothetical protein BGX30_012073 [Mortierella sp. GBA39]|nr:hypothetical protein BGX30_012073 [Mortierella sp. GBA39]